MPENCDYLSFAEPQSFSDHEFGQRVGILTLWSRAVELNLPNEVDDFIKGLVSQGRFDSKESAVVEGVRLLMTQEKLRAEIEIGKRQLDQGKWSDEETVFAEVNAEIDSIEASQRES
ncbi:MAG: hypothetical protein KDA42_18310 [Planctomycetales bacterium]|nr:hypothetical protein [Planctomycetales bacterium]